jgi:hypothetical protein
MSGFRGYVVNIHFNDIYARDLWKHEKVSKGRFSLYLYFIKDAATIPHAKVQERSIRSIDEMF